ncbi:hypothetical protein SAMN05216302_100792 [Nitrosomonas aestuarii]|uniref:Sulphur transport domain-containing protein n=2 Tax=Nitrosomonas aestuarii TaxID=52441 RepID=A0A1I3ZW61_9PROT|nr:hypothetical protein SAMN05216302_100792 [Nitrosomonas aestuarii]
MGANMMNNWVQLPWSALAGGVLIGLAAALFLLLNGRIAGISGITGGLFSLRRGDVGWRVAFILGLGISTYIWQQFFSLPAVQIEANEVLLVIAGLLVGFGTRYGSGCTSGHGVCGVARLSPRSIVATFTFMLTGFAMVYLLRHVIA